MEFVSNAFYSWDGVELSFGVFSNINLFEPNKPVRYGVRAVGNKTVNRDAIVQITCEDCGYFERRAIRLENGITEDSFLPTKNGLYSLKLIPLSLDMTLEFKVAVMPRARRANSSFSFSCQPYIARTITNAQKIKKYDFRQTEEAMLDIIDYMGFNAAREDSIYWGSMQKEPFGDVDFTKTDYLLKRLLDRGIALHWVLMGSTSWAIKDKYKGETDTCYCICPKTDMWCDYVAKFVDHYKDYSSDQIFYEIWNEPDWEFFHGTKEEFAELLEATARTVREKDSDAFVFSGGVSSPLNDTTDFRWHKKGGATLYLKVAKRLIEEGVLNTYSTHLHYAFNDLFFAFMDHGIGLAEKESGIINNGAYNTEAGVSSPDDDYQSRDNVAKALWFRSHGWGGFTQFAITHWGEDGEEGDCFAIMRGSIPRKSVVSYTVMIDKIGQAISHKNIADDRSIFADAYYDGEATTVTLFNDSEGGTGTGVLYLPKDVDFRAYDLYGNPIELPKDGCVTAQAAVVYIVCDGEISADAFSYKTASERGNTIVDTEKADGRVW